MLIFQWIILVLIALMLVFIVTYITIQAIKMYWDIKDIILIVISIVLLIGTSTLAYDRFPFTILIN